MLKILALTEFLIALVFAALLVWSFSGLCSGRLAGLDCESWSIIGVNFFAPMSLLLFVCSIW